jgi:hypothetical protein
LATGVTKEQLVPAYQELIISTKDAQDAQTLLLTAMNASAGSTNSLDSVVGALNKAYNGNRTSIQKMFPFLDKNLVKTGSMDDLVQELAKHYKGDAAKAAETFAGKVDRLQAAFQAAQGSLGKGFITGLMVGTDSKNIAELQKKIMNFGENAGKAIATLGSIISNNLETLKTFGAIFAGIWIGSKVTAGIYTIIGALNAMKKVMTALRATAIGLAVAEMFALNPLLGVAAGAGIIAATAATFKGLSVLESTLAAKQPKTAKPGGGMVYGKQDQKLLDNFKKLNNAVVVTTKTTKASNAATIAKTELDKLGQKFDVDRINLMAALAKATDEETKNRILAKIAILDASESAAAKLNKLGEAAYGATDSLTRYKENAEVILGQGKYAISGPAAFNMGNTSTNTGNTGTGTTYSDAVPMQPGAGTIAPQGGIAGMTINQYVEGGLYNNEGIVQLVQDALQVLNARGWSQLNAGAIQTL